MISTILIALHIFVSILLIISILLQPGKGGGMGVLFGGSSSTLFGGRGAATLLSKITTVLALLFMVLSIWITLTTKEETVSAGIESPVKQEAPVGAPPAEQQDVVEASPGSSE